ncbi:TetR/AcrR family transcriptional regulator [Alkalimarinus coralli]|uniref:TetR/AcrR family transcriptional regulator n=1 Tax=Alkalimarinus coralli TaxID=2935863 RepID=UPI00202B3787|nr:TetR/AcrR family transcriptional regulator [Alkalimarinus coralli]
MARQTAFNPDEKLHLAMQLFWQKGYGQTSMQEIVDTLEINRFSIYNTFGDKQQLFIKSLSHYLDTVFKNLIAPLKGTGNGKTRLDQYLQNLGEKLQSHSGRLGCLIQNTGLELTGSGSNIEREEIGQHLTGMYSALQSELERAFEDALNEGDLSAQRTPLQCADHVLAAIQGLILLRKTLNQPERIKDQMDFLRSTIKEW